MNIDTSTRDRRKTLLGGLLLLLVFGAITAWHFYPWVTLVWMGDDLWLYRAIQDGEVGGTFRRALASSYKDKYRPILWAYLSLMNHLFHNHLRAYFHANLLIHAISACFVFWIALLLSGRRFAVSLLAALAFCWSRFGLYQVGQGMFGPGEGLALVFFLLSLYAFLRAALTSTVHTFALLWTSVAAIFLAIFSHERYFLIPVVLATAVLMTSYLRGIVAGWRIVIAVAFVVVSASNVLIKRFVIGIPFLVGTGGTRIGVDLRKIGDHTLSGIASIFGFNYGPEYLVGIKITALPLYALVIAGLMPLGVMWAGATIFADPSARAKARAQWYCPALLVVLAGALLVPAVATIQIEHRWLLTPFALVLLTLCWAAGLPSGGHPLVRCAPVVLVCAASILIDQILMSRGFGQTYLVYHTRIAEAAKRKFIDGSAAGVEPIILLLPQPYCHWTLGDGAFFMMYAPSKRMIICAPDVAAAAAVRPNPETPVFVYQWQPRGRFVEVRAPHQN